MWGFPAEQQMQPKHLLRQKFRGCLSVILPKVFFLNYRIGPIREYSILATQTIPQIIQVNYTYFLGEQVTSAETMPEGLNMLAIPAQSYHIVPNAGPMPQTCINAWQEIWADSVLNDQRTYLVDFEKYDMAKMSPDHTEFEIYIGVRG